MIWVSLQKRSLQNSSICGVKNIFITTYNMISIVDMEGLILQIRLYLLFPNLKLNVKPLNLSWPNFYNKKKSKSVSKCIASGIAFDLFIYDKIRKYVGRFV